MIFKIEKSMLNLGGGIYTGAVAAFGLNNAEANEKIAGLLQGEVAKAAAELAGGNVKALPELAFYQRAMKEAEINPAKFPCSIEAILTRIAKKGEFPSLSPVVDLGNYISLKYRIPVGVHDLDTMEEGLYVRPATEEDCALEENKIDEKDPVTVGEPVYAAGSSIRTRRWIWRQMPAGRVDENSKNFLFPIDGFAGNKETVEKACDELVALLSEIFGVEAEKGVINPDNGEFHFGPMTEEEQEIENQIAMMLKGVAVHSEISDIRDKIRNAKKENRPLRVKLGLDPSAPDIHIGHTVVLRKIRQLQDMGHKAVIIIGDFTGMIGDPTGKESVRKQLTREQVEANAQTYMEQIFKVIDKDKTEVYYNSEWLGKMTFADVIELAAKCTVARMLERDDFNNRYTNHKPLFVHEFFYPLMQAYDSVAIKADIELGGTDQTFNILMGRNIQKDFGLDPQLTLFMPLLEGTDGVNKMSKSLNNYIGISEEPGVIFEKVMKIADNLIIKYYNLCTDVHPDEVAKLEKMMAEGTNPRDIKFMLAREITALYAGKDAVADAEERFKAVFQQKQVPDDAPVLTVDVSGDAAHGDALANALVESGFFPSKGEIRRVFQQGGAALDNEKVTDIRAVAFTAEEHVLKMGKAKFFKLQIKK